MFTPEEAVKRFRQQDVNEVTECLQQFLEILTTWFCVVIVLYGLNSILATHSCGLQNATFSYHPSIYLGSK
jgi:hypothetical protein